MKSNLKVEIVEYPNKNPGILKTKDIPEVEYEELTPEMLILESKAKSLIKPDRDKSNLVVISYSKEEAKEDAIIVAKALGSLTVCLLKLAPYLLLLLAEFLLSIAFRPKKQHPGHMNQYGSTPSHGNSVNVQNNYGTIINNF